MLFTIILALGLAVLLLWLASRPFYWAGKGIKYLVPKPIVGNFGSVANGVVGLSQKLYNEFPEEKLYGIHVFMTAGLVVRDPELIVDITIKDYDHFTDNGLGSNQDHDLTGGNLLYLHGQQWKEVRSKVSPFFTPMKIKAMMASVDVTLPKAMNVLNETIRVGEPCNQTNLLVQIVNDVITQAVFGVESDVYEKDSKFMPLAGIFFSPKTNFMNTMKILSRRLFRLLKLQSFDTDASLFLKRIVRDLVEYRKNNNVQGHDFVQGMMEVMEKHGQNSNGPVEYFPDGTRKPTYADSDGCCRNGNWKDWDSHRYPGTTIKPTIFEVPPNEAVPQVTEFRYQRNEYNFDEMYLHAFIIFLGGVESTATTMTWLFYELAKNQEVQERCRKEVTAVVDNKGRHVTMDDINELPYISAAIKEAVRMYPPFPMLTRVCTKTYIFKEQNLTMYPGQVVMFPTEAVQRDPAYFPKPDTFDPERFLGEDPKTGYISTFGLGPKLCLGKSFANYEMLLVVSRLLQKYVFKMSSKTEVPLVPNRFRPIYSPSTTLWLDVTHV